MYAHLAGLMSVVVVLALDLPLMFLGLKLVTRLLKCLPLVCEEYMLGSADKLSHLQQQIDIRITY